MRTEEETGSEGEQTRQEGDEHGRGEQGGMDGRTMAAPRPGPPAPGPHLVSLLLAHGQGQLELQLLLPAALRPGLLCLGWGPGAHGCGRG